MKDGEEEKRGTGASMEGPFGTLTGQEAIAKPCVHRASESGRGNTEFGEEGLRSVIGRFSMGENMFDEIRMGNGKPVAALDARTAIQNFMECSVLLPHTFAKLGPI